MKMSKRDLWLVKRWGKLLALEQAMKQARQQFESIYLEIHNLLKKDRLELDCMDTHVSPKEIENWGSNILFSKAVWTPGANTWRNGYYVQGITLDELSSDTSEVPNIYIFYHGKKNNAVMEKLRRAILAQAPKVFKGTKLKYQPDEDNERVILWFEIHGGKPKLLEMILSGEEQEFANHIARHLGIVAGFNPVMDRILPRK